MKLTYHGKPKAYCEGLDPNQPYIPPTFERDGRIHCTDGREAVSIILTIGNRHQPEVEFVVLYIDTDKVQAPVKVEDLAELRPPEPGCDRGHA